MKDVHDSATLDWVEVEVEAEAEVEVGIEIPAVPAVKTNNHCVSDLRTTGAIL